MLEKLRWAIMVGLCCGCADVDDPGAGREGEPTAAGAEGAAASAELGTTSQALDRILQVNCPALAMTPATWTRTNLPATWGWNIFDLPGDPTGDTGSFPSFYQTTGGWFMSQWTGSDVQLFSSCPANDFTCVFNTRYNLEAEVPALCPDPEVLEFSFSDLLRHLGGYMRIALWLEGQFPFAAVIVSPSYFVYVVHYDDFLPGIHPAPPPASAMVANASDSHAYQLTLTLNRRTKTLAVNGVSDAVYPRTLTDLHGTDLDPSAKIKIEYHLYENAPGYSEIRTREVRVNAKRSFTLPPTPPKRFP